MIPGVDPLDREVHIEQTALDVNRGDGPCDVVPSQTFHGKGDRVIAVGIDGAAGRGAQRQEQRRKQRREKDKTGSFHIGILQKTKNVCPPGRTDLPNAVHGLEARGQGMWLLPCSEASPRPSGGFLARGSKRRQRLLISCDTMAFRCPAPRSQ